MRIYYITQAGFDNPGAENTHALETIRHLVKRALQVTVLHPSRNAKIGAIGASECPAPPIALKRLNRLWFQFWLFFTLWRRHAQIDAIYVRQAAFMIVPALLRRRLRVPMVAEFNTHFARRENAGKIPFMLPLLKGIERKALKEYDRVIVISSSLRTSLLGAYDIPGDRIAVVHNGTNLDLMRPLPRDECRRALGLPLGPFVVAFVGTLHPWQGISALIAAIAELDPSKGSEVHLVIAGTSPHQSRYEAEAAARGLDGRAHFLGAVDYERVPHVISAADVAVAPGDSAQSTDYRIRSPLKIYEYLACGRPVIAGELDSIRELFAGDQVGFLVKPGHVPDLVAAMDILRADPRLAATMGSNARRLAERSLSWDVAAAQLTTILRSVTANGSGHSCSTAR
jgi:glycosyltransferase involved in cell wall biosynthesis